MSIFRNVGRRATLALAFAFVGSAMLLANAGVAEASGTGCSPPFTWEITHYQSCVGTDSSSHGLYVGTMSGWGRTKDAGYYHMELINPSGQFLANGPEYWYGPPPNESLLIADAVWSPRRNVPGGNYCAIVWKHAGGIYYDVAKACLGVHA